MSQDADFAQVVSSLHLVNLHAVASVTWLAYDILISMGDEVDLIWNSANTLPKLLYFFSRYFGFVVQLTIGSYILPLDCKGYLIWTGASVILLVFSVECSLVLRVYALYGKNRRMLLFLGSTFFLEIIVVVVLGAMAYPQVMPFIDKYPSEWHIDGCYIPTVPAFYKPSWAPVLIFETFLFALCMYRCFAYRPLNEVPILKRIARDGTVYYFVVFAGVLICVIGRYLANPDIYYVANVWLPAIFSFAGSRLLLSVRRLATDRDRLHHLQVLTPIVSDALPPISSNVFVHTPPSSRLPSPSPRPSSSRPPSSLVPFPPSASSSRSPLSSYPPSPAPDTSVPSSWSVPSASSSSPSPAPTLTPPLTHTRLHVHVPVDPRAHLMMTSASGSSATHESPPRTPEDGSELMHLPLMGFAAGSERGRSVEECDDGWLREWGLEG